MSSDNSGMSKRSLIPVLVLLLGVGCSPPPVSVLKPESEKLHIGMQMEDVKALCGEPAMNFTDPLSGSALWEYKDPKVGDHLMVTFNMDGLAKITYGAS
jgi:hypothetical protein